MTFPQDKSEVPFVTSPFASESEERLGTSERQPSGGSAVSAASGLQAFREQRGTLFGIAYRMLGSVADAEDMLQEAFIRWQQSSQEEIQSPRAFLITIVTRLCINHLESAKVRREEYYGQWLPEPILSELTEPGSASTLDVDESLSIAFLVMLERLTPAERAVFLLREVFDYDYPQIAQILELSQANCRQLLRRAKQHIADNRPRFDASHEQRERLTREFMQVVAGGDLQSLVSLLSQDVILHSDGGGKGPALPVQILGADKVARALLGAVRKFVPPNLTTHLTTVNGQPGAVSYLDGRAFSVLTLETRAGRITGVYIISNPQKLAHLSDEPSASA